MMYVFSGSSGNSGVIRIFIESPRLEQARMEDERMEDERAGWM